MTRIRASAVRSKENGWPALSALGSMIVINNPWFALRNHGCQKLGELVRKQPYIEIKEVSAGDGSAIVHLYVRPIA
jgi:hypothetical protein